MNTIKQQYFIITINIHGLDIKFWSTTNDIEIIALLKADIENDYKTGKECLKHFKGTYFGQINQTSLANMKHITENDFVRMFC